MERLPALHAHFKLVAKSTDPKINSVQKANVLKKLDSQDLLIELAMEKNALWELAQANECLEEIYWMTAFGQGENWQSSSSPHWPRVSSYYFQQKWRKNIAIIIKRQDDHFLQFFIGDQTASHHAVHTMHYDAEVFAAMIFFFFFFLTQTRK